MWKMAYPSKAIVSSVVRGANQGDSHGGLYIVDLERERFEQVVDWNDGSINFDGRGADRGLRGIAILDDLIFVAASDELFLFDRNFRIIASYRNAYLKHCHEMSLARGSLYLTSTGYDSILRFNLKERAFDLGLRVGYASAKASVASFDPQAAIGPAPSMALHLNNVHVDDYGIYVSGLKTPALLQLTSQGAFVYAEIPQGTHNARPFAGGVLLNDTEADHVVLFTPQRQVSIPTPRYPEGDLEYAGVDVSGVARQAFGRGLCAVSNDIVIGGSSPTTVSVYDLGAGARIKSVTITMDVRNAAHGLAVWPF